MPWTMGAFVLAGASLIGMPGTAGFISKWYLVSAAFEQGALGVVLVVIVISSLMALAYLWRVIEPAYFGPPRDPSRNNRHEAPLAAAGAAGRRRWPTSTSGSSPTCRSSWRPGSPNAAGIPAGERAMSPARASGCRWPAPC
jgi:hypothetical protein